MKTVLKSLVLAAFIMLGASAIGLLVNTSTAVAQGEEQADQTDTEQTSEEAPAEEAAPADETAPVVYDYIAQPRDSYSKIARKAVQTYGAIHNVSLSQAQIVAAETYLTQAAGSPKLTVGQEVSIQEAEVKSAVEKAQGLSESALALWEKYVPNVNFDTNAVGQPQAS